MKVNLARGAIWTECRREHAFAARHAVYQFVEYSYFCTCLHGAAQRASIQGVASPYSVWASSVAQISQKRESVEGMDHGVFKISLWLLLRPSVVGS